jgi:hypothetical protein
VRDAIIYTAAHDEIKKSTQRNAYSVKFLQHAAGELDEEAGVLRGLFVLHPWAEYERSEDGGDVEY